MIRTRPSTQTQSIFQHHVIPAQFLHHNATTTNTSCNPQSYCNPGAIPTSMCNRRTRTAGEYRTRHGSRRRFRSPIARGLDDCRPIQRHTWDVTHSVYICDHSRALHHMAHGSTLYRPEQLLAIPAIPSHLLANASFRSPKANQILTQSNTILNPRAIPTQS